MDAVPTTNTGVLGVLMSDPEVTAVYPELSATIQPHSQEIRFYRGDDLDLPVQVQNDGDPPDAVDITDSVMRFVAKQGFGLSPKSAPLSTTLGNDFALVVKTSSDPDQIEMDPSRGRAIVHLRREDTFDLPLVPAVWDLELIRPRAEISLPESSMVQVSAGNDMVFGLSGIDWTALKIRRGDLIKLQGRVVPVIEVISQVHLRVQFSNWTPAYIPRNQVVLRRGQTKTIAFGAFIVMGDVTM